MSEYWIDIEQPYGTKSVGPIKTASFWESTDRLDRAGEFVFEMPASDSRVDLFRALDKRYYARCYSIVGGTKIEEGAGVIEAVTYKKSSNSLVISGTDLFLELADLSVEALEILDEETRTPDSVQYYDGTATSYLNMALTFDGSAGSGVAVPADDEDWFYVGDADPFDIVDFHLGADRNSDSGDFSVTYPPATGTWAGGSIISDTTKANETDDPASPNNWGASWWTEDGQIRWERQAAWATSTVNSVADKYWLRFRYSEDMTAAANGGEIDINEIEIVQELPTSTALSDILAYASAWALSGSFHSKTETDVYMKFAHESVLTALIRVAERTGEHFRRGTGRLIEWLQDDETAASVRAVSNVDAVGAQDNALVCLITRFEETKDVRDVATRIYPFGAGVAGARITLAQTTHTSAGDYVVHPTGNYIQSTAGVAAYGQIQRAMTWGEVGAINAAGTVDTNASNSLYLAAVEYLERHKTKGRYYKLELTKLDAALKVGQVLPVQYKHYEAGFELVDVDEDLWVLEKTTRLNANGTRVVNLLVSTIDTWPEDPDDAITTGIEKIREFLAYGGPFNASGLTLASIDALLARLDLSRYYLKPTDTKVVLGVDAGNVPPADNHGVFVGNEAGYSSTSGQDNTFLGYRSGRAITTGYDNTIVGSDGMRLGLGTGNTGVGYRVLENVGTTSDGLLNTAVGHQAMRAMDEGDYNVAMGSDAMVAAEASNCVALGYKALSDVTGDDNIAVGYQAGLAVTSAVDNILIGTSAASTLLDGDGNVVIGFNAMVACGTNVHGNIAIGYLALENVGTSGIEGSNVAVGNVAMEDMDAGSFNVAVGASAMENFTSGDTNVAVGQEALKSTTTGSGSDNVAIGYSALVAITSGDSNVGVGSWALASITTGNYNIAVGEQAMMYNAESSNNIVIGYQAGYKGSPTTYDDCVIIGYQAGYALESGDNNVLIGHQAGLALTGAANVFIGYLAGSQAVGVSNQLYIENSNSATPLIYGEFDNDLVKIHGDLCLGTEDGGGRLNFTEGTAIADGIVWGSDANKVTLYRSADDMLKTDDALTVVLGLNVGSTVEIIKTDADGLIISSAAANASRLALQVNTTGTNSWLAATKTGTGTFLPLSFFTSDIERMRITTAGNLGIGVAAGGYRLNLLGEYAAEAIVRFHNDGNNANRHGIDVLCGADNAAGTTYVIAAKDGDGDWVGALKWVDGVLQIEASPQRRDMHGISPTDNVLQKLSQLKVIDYTYKGTKARHRGFVPEEMMAIFPQVVSYNEQYDHLGTTITNLIPIHTRAIQELDGYRLDADAEREAMRARLDSIERRG